MLGSGHVVHEGHHVLNSATVRAYPTLTFESWTHNVTQLTLFTKASQLSRVSGQGDKNMCRVLLELMVGLSLPGGPVAQVP